MHHFFLFFLFGVCSKTLINYCSYSEKMGSANFSSLKFKATCGNAMSSHFLFSHHYSHLLYFGHDLFMFLLVIALIRDGNRAKALQKDVSTHLGEVLQRESFGHVVELGATHGFSHGQHSQTVSSSQLFLWSQ